MYPLEQVSNQPAVLVQARKNHTHLNSRFARLRVGSAKCQCGMEDETVAHVVLHCSRRSCCTLYFRTVLPNCPSSSSFTLLFSLILRRGGRGRDAHTAAIDDGAVGRNRSEQTKRELLDVLWLHAPTYNRVLSAD
jgi:hypothetical protein